MDDQQGIRRLRDSAFFLTLDEAASELSERSGESWGAMDLIAAAHGGRCFVLAPWAASVRLVRLRPRLDDDNERLTVVGEYGAISQRTARELMLSRSTAGMYGTQGLVDSPQDPGAWALGDEWTLAAGEVAPTIELRQCRTHGGIWQVLLGERPRSLAGAPAPPDGAQSTRATAPTVKKPDERAERIREVLEGLNINPDELPAHVNGKENPAKSAARAALVPREFTAAQFKHAWERFLDTRGK
jgi:hypothetical protein